MTEHKAQAKQKKQGSGGAASTLVGQINNSLQNLVGEGNRLQEHDKEFKAIEAEPTFHIRSSRCALREMMSMLHQGLLTFGFLRTMPAPRTLTAGASAGIDA